MPHHTHTYTHTHRHTHTHTRRHTHTEVDRETAGWATVSRLSPTSWILYISSLLLTLVPIVTCLGICSHLLTSALSLCLTHTCSEATVCAAAVSREGPSTYVCHTNTHTHTRLPAHTHIQRLTHTHSRSCAHFILNLGLGHKRGVDYSSSSLQVFTTIQFPKPEHVSA